MCKVHAEWWLKSLLHHYRCSRETTNAFERVRTKKNNDSNVHHLKSPLDVVLSSNNYHCQVLIRHSNAYSERKKMLMFDDEDLFHWARRPRLLVSTKPLPIILITGGRRRVLQRFSKFSTFMHNENEKMIFSLISIQTPPHCRTRLDEIWFSSFAISLLILHRCNSHLLAEFQHGACAGGKSDLIRSVTTTTPASWFSLKIV